MCVYYPGPSGEWEQVTASAVCFSIPSGLSDGHNCPSIGHKARANWG